MTTIGYYLVVDYEGTVGDPVVFYEEQIDKYKGTYFYKFLKEVDLMAMLKDEEHFIEERKYNTRGFEIDGRFRYHITKAIVYDLEDAAINKYLEEIGFEKAKDSMDFDANRKLLETVIMLTFGINKNYTEVFAQSFNREDEEIEYGGVVALAT